MAVGPPFLYIFIKFELNFLDLNTISQTYFFLGQAFFSIDFRKIQFFGLDFFHFYALGKVAIKIVEVSGPIDEKNKFQYPK